MAHEFLIQFAFGADIDVFTGHKGRPEAWER